jgi:hypothetical protein
MILEPYPIPHHQYERQLQFSARDPRRVLMPSTSRRRSRRKEESENTLNARESATLTTAAAIAAEIQSDQICGAANLWGIGIESCAVTSDQDRP